MSKHAQAIKLRKSTAAILGGRCDVCAAPFRAGFSFHHIGYNDGEKKYSDFKTWEDYQIYVMPIIQADTGRFALLCRKHHRPIELLKLMKRERLVRLMLLTMLSRDKS